ncbi:MAG: 50S ribosomal protein L18 [Chitinophagales bacterium]|nr:50S ribosomal protein L18 [Chitinophagales bacterium]HMV15984.1 50S ribosomal protein L18 [Chitinophagales bacterium]HMW13762.1 50S ribosomal protein L18 [Chitinophagales bacterium]HMX61001.1 50S ribosomal protein L18 [Chitinophagales bacterium]HMY24029.1 50S ribosomal protein L18 [Chitinophagales bacterium]
MAVTNKLSRREKIKFRIRKKISGTTERPRLCVFRSNSEIYAQIIDDATGKTIASVSSQKSTGTKTEKAKAVGASIASKAKDANIANVIFDRNGFLYHGRIKALADAARENGLQF